MNRSRSPSRRGPGRPKGSTRKEDPSSTDHESDSVNRSQRRSRRMRLVSPSTPSTSRASSAQPRRHKNLTATRRAVMTFFIQAAQESPKKNGKIGSLQWMGKVLKTVNKAAKGVTDRVTNLDVIWWLEKHFSDKVKDFTGPIQPTWRTSRERSSSLEFEEQENGRSGSWTESSDEASTDGEESEVENSRVVRQRKAKEATPRGGAENLFENVEPAQEGAERGLPEAEYAQPKAVGNGRGEAVIPPEPVIALEEVANALEVADDSQVEAEEAHESARIARGLSSSSCVKLTAANDEAPAAIVQRATSATEAAVAPSPQVLDLDNQRNQDGNKESRHDTLRAGSGTDADGELVFQALAASPPENPTEGVCLEGADPAVGGKKAAGNPLVRKLEIQMEVINLQLNMLKKDKRYSEQVEVLTAQSKAMTAMISLLYKI